MPTYWLRVHAQGVQHTANMPIPGVMGVHACRQGSLAENQKSQHQRPGGAA